MKLPKNPWWETPWKGVPKPILKAHRTHTMSTTENAMNASIMLLMDQRFCITPPYSTASPGTLISPTRVAAVICQDVSPGFSHEGASTSMNLLRFDYASRSCGGWAQLAQFRRGSLASGAAPTHGLRSSV